MANSVDPDQTPRSAASDLGLHCSAASFLVLQCLPRPVCPKFRINMVSCRNEKPMKDVSFMLIAILKIDIMMTYNPYRQSKNRYQFTENHILEFSCLVMAIFGKI